MRGALEVIVYARIERGHGPLRIRSDLREAGIDGETTDLLLEAESEHWDERLRMLIERRYGGCPEGRPRLVATCALSGLTRFPRGSHSPRAG